jgi:hypothetical protein
MKASIKNYADNFVLKAVEFWYDLPDLGLQQIVDETLPRALAVEEMYYQRREPLQNAHQDFTLAVDRLYGIKSEYDDNHAWPAGCILSVEA